MIFWWISFMFCDWNGYKSFVIFIVFGILGVMNLLFNWMNGFFLVFKMLFIYMLGCIYLSNILGYNVNVGVCIER